MSGDSSCATPLSHDPSLIAHCRRVAAIGQAVAHHLFLPSEQKSLLYAASLFHHHHSGAPGDAVRGVLRSVERPGAGSENDHRLAEIVRFADSYDCEYEASALEETPINELLPRLRDAAAGGLWSAGLIDSLEQFASTNPLGDPASWRLPCFDASAARILPLLNNPSLSMHRLEEAAGADPAIAGKLVQLANSALFYSRSAVSTLAAAVTRLGFQTARKVIAASLTRPLLSSPRMHTLWLHSLESADLAEQLADRTGTADPGEACLCGLLHDVGALILERLTLFDAARLQGLEEGGCPKVYAENLVLRRDHAELGADLAAWWNLPPHLAEAIRHHHRPSQSPLSNLLYLTEFLTGTDEDLPSRRRLTQSLEALGLPFEDIVTLKVSSVAAWLAA
jgi:putative nucleotidyltransferase with HDIG domain